VIECVPCARILVEKLAVPDPLNMTVPRTVEPSRTFACPAGTPFALVTRTLKVAGFPAGTVDEAELTVVCVAACCTVWEMAAEVLGISLRSPP
jgi:hypothetical protein